MLIFYTKPERLFKPYFEYQATQAVRQIMRKYASSFTACIIVLIAAIAIGQADPYATRGKPDTLGRTLATQLIADFYEIGENEVKIAYIINGKLKKDGFESDIGAEVTFIRPVVDNGRRRRAVHSIHFQHDKELGWFLRAIVQEDGRGFIDICSEKKGRIRIE